MRNTFGKRMLEALPDPIVTTRRQCSGFPGGGHPQRARSLPEVALRDCAPAK
jgi:hypothetical protein